jgi:hypothetical protein
MGWGNLRERDHLEEQSVDGRIILRWIFRKWDEGMDWIDLAKGACTHTGFLPESDPAPVVEFFTRTGITAAGGQFDFERCTRKMFVRRNRCRFHTD